MANNMKWIKLHTALLNDPKFENLSVSTWALWIRPLMAVGLYGNGGSLEVTRNLPGGSSRHAGNLRASRVLHADYRYIQGHLEKLAKLGVLKWTAKADGTLTVDIINWNNYQSALARNGVDRGEEKREEETEGPTTVQFSDILRLWRNARGKEVSIAVSEALNDLCQLTETFRLALTEGNARRAQSGMEWVYSATKQAIQSENRGKVISVAFVQAILHRWAEEARAEDDRKAGNGRSREVIGVNPHTGEPLYAS